LRFYLNYAAPQITAVGCGRASGSLAHACTPRHQSAAKLASWKRYGSAQRTAQRVRTYRLPLLAHLSVGFTAPNHLRRLVVRSHKDETAIWWAALTEFGRTVRPIGRLHLKLSPCFEQRLSFLSKILQIALRHDRIEVPWFLEHSIARVFTCCEGPAFDSSLRASTPTAAIEFSGDPA